MIVRNRGGSSSPGIKNMCLYPKNHINKKYTITDKNGGKIPELPIIGTETYIKDYENTGSDKEPNWVPIYAKKPKYDTRVLNIEIPCGQCQECRSKKAHEWQARLSEELKNDYYYYFVTLTFSPEGLREILFSHHIKECNAACTYALRKCLERWRKTYKKSLRHWFVTELGHEGTERIHMHGLIMSEVQLEYKVIEQKPTGVMAEWKYWKYGHIFIGNYVNQQSINYLVKYIEKVDQDHKTFRGQVLCSPGIGRSFLDRIEQRHDISYRYKGRETKNYYRLPNGCKINLSTYYKNHLRNENEREQLWRDFMDMHKHSVTGINYDYRYLDRHQLENIINKAQEISHENGFGDDSKEWRKLPHNITKRMIQDQRKKANMAKMNKAIEAKLEKNRKKLQENLQDPK